MKKIIIGALVGAVIYFGFQTMMWVGGFHRHFYTYTPNQDTIMSTLSANLPAEGLYMMPMGDPQSPDFKAKQEEIEKTMVGNPWAMVFYHPKMNDFSPLFMIVGFVYTLLGTLMVAFVIYIGKFPCFWSRFTVSMLFAFFTLIMGVMVDMHWWEFPWSFIKPQVIDLLLGWGLCSVWLGWYVRRKEVPVQ